MKLIDVTSLDELAQLFGYADYESFKSLIYPIPHYWAFLLPKKGGGSRIIETPGLRLKIIQRLLASQIAELFGRRSPAAHSFMRGRSVVSNAFPHVGRASVVRLDLKDFFHQIHFGRVKGVFLSAPFGLPADVATVLAHICCYQGRLPQGAPTSPALTNFVCLSLDRLLGRIARRYKCRFTRYADDLSFSFSSLPLAKIPKELFFTTVGPNGHPQTEAGPLIAEAIKKHGFLINTEKTRGTNSSKRQMVTGIVVNKGLSLPRRYVDQVRRALFLWRKMGLAEAEKRALPILHSKKYASGSRPSLPNLLRGKLAWLAQVTGRSGTHYQALASLYNRLVVSENLAGLQVRIDPCVKNITDATNATWHLVAKNETGLLEVSGTAFRLKGNVWVTCAHCAGSLQTKTAYAQIALVSGALKIELPVRIVDIEWHLDIAILRPIPMVPTPRNLAYFDVSRGQVVADTRLGVLGFPSSNIYQPPIFMRTRVVRVRAISGVSRVEIDKPILGGNSGGPVFDEHYRLVGIVVEGGTVTEGMNACISASELKHLRRF